MTSPFLHNQNAQRFFKPLKERAASAYNRVYKVFFKTVVEADNRQIYDLDGYVIAGNEPSNLSWWASFYKKFIIFTAIGTIMDPRKSLKTRLLTALIGLPLAICLDIISKVTVTALIAANCFILPLVDVIKEGVFSAAILLARGPAFLLRQLLDKTYKPLNYNNYDKFESEAQKIYTMSESLSNDYPIPFLIKLPISALAIIFDIVLILAYISALVSFIAGAIAYAAIYIADGVLVAAAALAYAPVYIYGDTKINSQPFVYRIFPLMRRSEYNPDPSVSLAMELEAREIRTMLSGGRQTINPISSLPVIDPESLTELDFARAAIHPERASSIFLGYNAVYGTKSAAPSQQPYNPSTSMPPAYAPPAVTEELPPATYGEVPTLDAKMQGRISSDRDSNYPYPEISSPTLSPPLYQSTKLEK